MNPPKCTEQDYINFLVAAPKVFCNTEAARCHPNANSDGPAHDAYTRLLHRCQSDGKALWEEARPYVSLEGGMLVLDDTTLDKFYAHKIEMGVIAVTLLGEMWHNKLPEHIVKEAIWKH